MGVGIKFCGLTRAQDAVHAASLGAAYLGFIFAPSKRQLTVDRAEALLREFDAWVGGEGARRPRRVGVFADLGAPAIAAIVERLALDVIQLHGTDDARLIESLRVRSTAQIWTVVHVGIDGVEARQLERAMRGDGVLLDAKVEGMLGGTGVTFDWARERERVESLRAGRSIILAGGLRASNVAQAIATFAPDVVDVSSGVESRPGVKDPALMRAFAQAAHGTTP